MSRRGIFREPFRFHTKSLINAHSFHPTRLTSEQSKAHRRLNIDLHSKPTRSNQTESPLKIHHHGVRWHAVVPCENPFGHEWKNPRKKIPVTECQSCAGLFDKIHDRSSVKSFRFGEQVQSIHQPMNTNAIDPHAGRRWNGGDRERRRIDDFESFRVRVHQRRKSGVASPTNLFASSVVGV